MGEHEILTIITKPDGLKDLNILFYGGNDHE
jgi:hypothetical protein